MKKKMIILLTVLITDLLLFSLLFYFYINDLYIFEDKIIEVITSFDKSSNPENDYLPIKELTKYELPEEIYLDINKFVKSIDIYSGNADINRYYDHNEIIINNDEVVLSLNKISLYKDTDYSFSINMSSSEDSSIRLVVYDEDYDTVFLDENYDCNGGNETFNFSTGNFTSYTTRMLIYLDNIKSYTLNDFGFSSNNRTLNTITTNQLGYKINMQKIACFSEYEGSYFEVFNKDLDKVVFKGPIVNQMYDEKANQVVGYGDFSSIVEAGNYYIKSQFGNYSYDFVIEEDVYDSLIIDALKMISSQRCGYDLPISIYGEFGHPACHTSLIEAIDFGFSFEASGGWHDAGDYGRYTSTIDKTATELMMAYIINPDLYGDDMNILESGNDVSDILDEVKVATDYLMKIQLDDGSFFDKVVTESFADWVEPLDDNNQLYAFPPSTITSAYSAGVLIMAYDLFKDFDDVYAQKCLESAKIAYDYVNSKGFIGIRSIEKFSNNGEYRDSEDYSERYFMNMLFGVILEDGKYIDISKQLVNDYGIDIVSMDYYNPSAYASYLFAIRNDEKEYEEFKEYVIEEIVNKANEINMTIYSNGYLNSNNGYNWGTNYQIANYGAILGFAYDITENITYLNNACYQLHYILGNNVLSMSYVTGYGTNTPTNIHHRISSVKGVTIKGAMVGGPNEYRELNEGLNNSLNDIAPAKNYIDSQSSYSTNEVAIYYNSSLELLLSIIN